MRRHRGGGNGCIAVCAVLALGGWLLPVGAQQVGARPQTPVATPAQLLFLAAAAAPPVAQGRGQVLGYVVNDGQPLAGAVVEIRAEGLRTKPLQRVTSPQGLFQVLDLAPGTYYVLVGKGQRVAARRRVQVRASERALLLVSLPKLLHEVRFGPPPGISADEAFAWALRQQTLWKPILRLSDPADASAKVNEGPNLDGFVALTAGAGDSAFAASDVATTFAVNSIAWGAERLSLTGTLGTNGGIGGTDTTVQAKFESADPSNPARMMVSLRQMSIPGRPALPELRVLSFNYANAVNLGSSLRVQYGSMLNAVSMTDTVATVDPYVRAMLQVGTEGQLEYRALSGVPPLHFDRNYASMDDPTPRVTLDQNRARLERARHQEVRYSESLSPNDSISMALFSDHYTRAAVNGAFSLSGTQPPSTTLDADAGLLPDLLNNMFLADGGSYGGWGYRAGVQHRLSANWKAAVGFSDGEVLAPRTATWDGGLAASLQPERAHAVTLKLSGIVPLTHTQLVCSYRALSRPAATGLDLYDDSFTQSRSFANVYLRQPLPGVVGAGGRLAALVEIHNLLAQGYIPMLASDGRTLYLVQSARSLRGGLTITF